MLIDILVFPGVDELDALAPLEVFRDAKSLGADFETRLVSLDDTSELIGAHGLRFYTDGILGSPSRADLLVVPGGGWIRRSPQGAWAEVQRRTAPQAIAGAHEGGAILASVCTGAMLIAATGLLRGRRAITHKAAIDELREYGAEIVSARVVDDEDIVTSGGVTAGVDLALHLVERFTGARLSDEVARDLEYERQGLAACRAGRTWGLRRQAAS
ncbi:MAG TPA: DJ-1/PfpI family protein [Candidatus Limnocylindrales bacterium]|nr:DJ-1/PfpI family protein [Candidatus Limnocylindrales bacterium]